MEEKDYYLLKDVILGLRNEYLTLQRMLDELKKYVIFDERKVKNINFTLKSNDIDEKIYNLYCRVQIKIHDVKSLLYNCLMAVNSDKNIKNIKLDDISTSEYLKIDNESELKKQASNILDLKMLENAKIAQKITDGCFSGLFVLTPLKLGVYSLDNNSHIPNIIYYSYNDTIRVYDLYDRVFNETLIRGLQLQIPKSIFSDYQRTIIDNNISSNKEIVIAKNLNYFRDETININEDDNKIYLKKSIKY